ncbi:cell division protein FtsQ/DivIB [Vagococcus xieshaowenii]|uniref:Cell division protein DivIB n=1 Tax=Vagococcus xieshaowenii TaxID=2562451 RepID=A0AAJ5EFU5_9ENTE|nr:FtsQ-type POTRA domain-containing protein [Vagococcus xieshaowenii]QCA28988.1 FtsQ-type POTRA domain-containing protein [Vagococcus xieshaowenii]TFZ43169.1 FtsQ-type POTRA domain-containing protein [Vagococcus xieshaowenii]
MTDKSEKKTIGNVDTLNDSNDVKKVEKEFFENLTPWQKENLKYLQENGEEPKWMDKPEEESKPKPLSFDKKSLEELIEMKQEQKMNSTTNSEKSEAQDPNNTGDISIDKDSTEETLSSVESKDNVLDLKKILKETVADESDIAYESEMLKKETFADKLPKIRQERRRRMLKRLSLILSMFLLVLLLTAYYVSPYSKVQTLEIVGNSSVTKQEIASATGLKKNEFFWNAYLNEPIIDNIKKALPRIKSVEKSIYNVNNIKLNVTEYNELAYAKFEGKFYPILESGKILDKAVTSQNKSFTVFTNFSNDKQLERMLTIYLNMEDKIKNNLDEVVLNPSGKVRSRIVLRMKDGNQVIGSIKDLGDKIVYYPEISKEMTEPGVIDMEAGIFSYSYTSKEASEKLAGLGVVDKKESNKETKEDETTVEQTNMADSEDNDELIDELQNNN